MAKSWFKRTFTLKRFITAFGFSVTLGVSVWATKLYEQAFASSNVLSPLLVLVFLTAFLMLFGGAFLDLLSKMN